MNPAQILACRVCDCPNGIAIKLEASEFPPVMPQSPLQPQSRQSPILQSSVETLDAPDWAILDEEWLSDEPELESDLHRDQIDLLLHIMKWYWRNRQDIYCSGNTTVYYDESQRTNRNFRGPDVYVVLGATPRPRNSWMVWREGGKYPNVVIELLSNSTAKVDRTTKKDLYQNDWQLPNYFWFHPQTKEFKGFRLNQGKYEPISANQDGHLWSDQLALFLGIHEGSLRLFTPAGELILTREEEEALNRQIAEQAASGALQQAEQERELKEQAQQLAQQERLQREQERWLKEQAQQQAEQERLQKEQAMAELERLSKRLRELES